MAKITITDIANQAGVAKSTVSRYLNGGSISKKTRQKIDEIIQERDFKPNAFAQSLKQQTSRTIGVIVPRLDSYAQTEMLRGLDHANNDDVFLIMNTYQDHELVERAIDQVEILRLSGLIIFSANLSKAVKEKIKALNVPVVIQGQDMTEFARVIVDDELAGKSIGALAKRAKSSLIISVDPEKDFEVGHIRYQAVRAMLTGDVDTVYADFSLVKAKQLTANALATKHYDTVIAMSDLMAAGAIQSLNEKDLAIPTAVKVYGIGGTLISDLVSPNITTFAFDYFEVGQQLYKLFKIQQNKQAPTLVRVGGMLIEKQSS